MAENIKNADVTAMMKEDIEGGILSRKKYVDLSDEEFKAKSDEVFKELGISGFKKFIIIHGEIWKFVKFTLVGFSSTLVELAVFYLLQYVVFKNIAHAPMPDNAVFKFLGSIGLAQGLGIFYSYVISTTIGYIIAFILNRKTTFKADSNVVLSTVLYIIMVIFTIIATAWIGTVFQNFMASHNLKALGDIITKPLVATLATAWTYPINRFVIHRHKKTEEETPAE